MKANEKKSVPIEQNVWREMAQEKLDAGKDIYELVAEAWECYKSSKAAPSVIVQTPAGRSTKNPIADDPFAAIQSQYSKTVDQAREKFSGGLELLERFKSVIEQAAFHVAAGDFKEADRASRPIREKLRKHGSKSKNRPKDTGASQGAA